MTALEPDAIIASLRIPIAREKKDWIRAYKQAKRKDDDIAIVNAALRVSLSDSNLVNHVELIYGGLGPTTVSAKEATAYLKGKNWTDSSILEGAMNALGTDFDLRWGVPGGMPLYRKSLALGFFYRFYHEVLSQLDAENPAIDGDAQGEIERAISSGEKDHGAAQAYEQRILGKAEPHVAALKQCTGQVS